MPAPEGPTIAIVCPAGASKRHAAQDRPRGVVMELDVLEPHRARGHLEVGRAGRVADFRVLVEDVEHRADVDDRLLDLAIDHAHEVQRLVELQHHHVEQHEVADGIMPFADALDAHDEHRDHAGGEDDRLARVQHRERDIGAHAEALVARHRLVVAHALALLGAEIFDRLEIQQAVDRLGVGVGVAVVHRAPDGDAPVGRERREDEIGEDRHADRDDIAPVERDQQRRDDQHEFERGRRGGEHRGADDRLDRGAPALENARQAAGLALEMEAQRKLMQVDEDLDREAADRVHRHRGEQGVAALLGKRHQDAQDAVKAGERNDALQDAREGARWRAPRR